MSKKILIYGENWPGTLPRLLLDDLTSKNFECAIFDFTDHLPGIKNRALLERIKRRLFIKHYTKKIQTLFLDKVKKFKPEIIIIAKGLHLHSPILQEINTLKIKTINWNPDDFFNMKNSDQNLIQAMPFYDLIVSSRPHLFEHYKKNHIKHLLYLDWYFVPHLHYKHNLPIRYTITFVGSWSPSREEFISHITTPLTIWGGGWEKASNAFKNQHKVQSKILSQIEMSQVFSSSRFNLNLLTHENSDFSNLRFFEVPASGGLLLTEKNDCAESYLTDMADCIMFRSADDVNQILLKSDNLDLDQICTNGHTKIIQSKNSFGDRVNELITYF